MSRHVAIDLGAESGRVMLGEVSDDGIVLDELHRFATQAVRIQGHWRWNVYRIFEGIVEGLRVCAESHGTPDSVGVDTWGVDFGLLARDGSLIGLPVAYRDDRTAGMMERFFSRMPREAVYAKTGVQFMRLNSLYQLFAVAQDDPVQLDIAERVLFMPDVFHYLLCGEAGTEFTFATTTQLYNVQDETWDAEICAAAGFDAALLGRIVPTGETLGRLLPEVCEQTGLGPTSIVLPATHDTGSAVAAIPAEGEDWAYISSGTWSLVGVELSEPNCSDAALRYNFTNEGGAGGTFRFLKNVMGLWLVQRLRADYPAIESYEALVHLANETPNETAYIDPDAEDFYHPASMREAIEAYCRRTKQRVPESPGAFVRCALESLALRYREVIEQVREVTGKPIHCIHIVGGGSQNALLCQWTADATGLPVLGGPAECTALGNVIAQAVGTGTLDSFSKGRELVAQTTEPTTYTPGKTQNWNDAYTRFRAIVD